MPVSCRLAGTRVGGRGAPHHWQTGEGFWATELGATGWALWAVLSESASGQKGGPEEQEELRAQRRL